MQPLTRNDPHQIGPYRLLYRLGSGGMGIVYLGVSPGGRAVAVKIIYPHLASEPAFVYYFRREVDAAKAVSGAYTASVVGSGLDDDPPWLATVYVEGPSLADTVITFGPLPEMAVWRLAGGLVEALQAVHSCGLVHRDLKPANVLLAPDGPKVIDFGISRALEKIWTTIGNRDPVGTPAYMSPEQADGEKVEPASDVFSLGSVIAFAATGKALFGGGPPIAEIYRVIRDEPDLSGIGEPLRDLVADCLRKKPEDRPELDQLLTTIAARSEAHGPAAPSSFWPRSLATFIRSRYDITDAGQPSDGADLVTELAGDLAAGDLATELAPGGQPVELVGAVSPVLVLVAEADRATDSPPAAIALADPGKPEPDQALPVPEMAGLATPAALGLATPAPVGLETAEPALAVLMAARRRRTRRIALARATSVVLVAAVAAVVWVLVPGGQRHAAPTAVSISWPTQQYAHGLVVSTRWTLSGNDGSSLSERIIATDSADAALSVKYQQPVPTAVVTTLATATFTPAAPMIIQHGTGLVWPLRIPAHGQVAVSFRVALPPAGVSKTRLLRLLHWLSRVKSGPVTIRTRQLVLESLSIMPMSLRIAVGQRAVLTLVGRLSNGERAPAHFLSNAIWRSSDSQVAAVNVFAKVTALAVGTSTVIAKVGTVTTSITVTVTTSLTVPSNTNTQTVYTPPPSKSHTPTGVHTSTATPIG